MEYAVQLVAATREPSSIGRDDLSRYLTFGASPRAAINMVLAARALAYLRGRPYALAIDISDLALDVMRHRLILSYEALGDSVTADMILGEILNTVGVPELRADLNGSHPGADTAFERGVPPAAEQAVDQTIDITSFQRPSGE